ncbi:hypothetical protein P8H27_05155 [Pseudomonas sp. sp1636]|uniref:hypothetical protein n=1 Tax=Pseudomonas sp. sp1636 TaxID=3036707 RepID=UPI0025A51595|nr:hypothetical protein [Pseudomonas sp. sp1636]MDM8348281.1 hypothetical protein [Pseudomonas sp. sp1636]
MNMEANIKSTPAKLLAWLTGGLSSVIGICWAIITYVFPDPSVFGLGVVNWKNFLSFFAAFVFMMAMMIAMVAWRLPTIPRRMVNFTLAAGLSAGFFVIGMEYAKPSFEFAKAQERIVENDSPTLFGKRMEMVDSVRISLVNCNFIAQTPSCVFEFNSTNKDREVQVRSVSAVFEPDGNNLRLEKTLVGNEELKYGSIELVRNLNTKVTLIFKQTRNDLSTIPSVKLVLNGLDNYERVIKFNEVSAAR